MSADRPVVVFFPEGAYGPTNNCVGIGDVLRRRGARVIFVVEESFAGTLEAKGFEEELMRLKPPPEVEEEPGQFWKDFIRDTAPHFRSPTIEQLETIIKPIWEELIDGATFVDDRLQEIFERVGPDVIVEDNVVAFPAVLASGRPWVRIVSCNPLELDSRDLPPAFSGYPTSDRSGWDTFRARRDELHRDVHRGFDELCRAHGAPPLPPGQFIHESEWLNLYVYPDAADYPRSRPLAPTWHRLESSVRTTDEGFELPERMRDGRPVVYLSLGSLGSADVELMQRLIELLGDARHHVIVSLGPQHERLRPAPDMYGAEFLPQTSILPLVDLAITHGGNNTVTECFHFGVPMIVLPLFWDQYDNAQRVDELGYGVRLDPYRFRDRELPGAIDRLLGDASLRAGMGRIASRLHSHRGTQRAADLIERVARAGAPATR